MSNLSSDPEGLKAAAKHVLMRAKTYGATSADVLVSYGRHQGITIRASVLEDIDNSEGRELGLRVMIGHRQACVSSSDLSADVLDQLAERAVAMARLAPEDPYCGLAPPERLFQSGEDLDLFDPTDFTPQDLQKRALRIEAAALSIKGVSQAEGAHASQAMSRSCFMTSAGFAKELQSSHHDHGVAAYAANDDMMERDFKFSRHRWFSELLAPEDVGRIAGERAVARLGARQIESGHMPIIFGRRVANHLIESLMSAVSGPSITRGMSFLKDKLGTAIFPRSIQIKDDPLIKRGYASRLWDGEGVASTPMNIIKDGVLETWLLNMASARQLDMESTGHGFRPLSAAPGVSTSNVYMQAGTLSPAQLGRETGEGLWVGEMFGPSLNMNTGDYSVGVAGFKLEAGARTYPVSEITIAGNLLDMFATITPADDLIFDKAVAIPTLRVEGMTVAGT